MPRFRRRRGGYKGKRKYGRKRVSRTRPTYTKRGVLRITRKLPEIAVANTAVGTATLTDPTGTCLAITNLGLSTGASANLYDISFGMRFRLDQLINSSDITTLCDKYKIVGAYVRIFYNNSNSSASTVGGMPFVQYLTDHDGAGAPSSVNQLRECMGLKMKSFKNASSFIGIKVRPTPTREIFATGLLSGYEVPNKSVFIDCNNPNVEHYGIKGILSQVYLPAPASAQSMFKFDVTLALVGKDFQ